MEVGTIIEIVCAAAGLLVVSTAVALFLRFRRKRKHQMMTRPFSDWKPIGRKKTAAEIQPKCQQLPVSVTRVATQTPIRPPVPKSLNLKLENETENGFKYQVFSKMKRGNSQGSLQRDLYVTDEQTSTESSTEDNNSNVGTPQNVSELTKSGQDSGSKTPDCLPEQWSTPTYATTIEFTVTYVNSSNVLAIHVTRLINLPNWKPFKSSNSHRIKIKLVRTDDKMRCRQPSLEPEPEKSSSTIKRWHSHSSVQPGGAHLAKNSIKKTFDVENGAFMAFSGFNLAELRNYCLDIRLYEMKYKKLREKLIGECVCSLAQLELEAGTSATCMEELKLKNNSMSKAKSLGKAGGQLLLSLYYQTEANRMKVLVRKATDLPKQKLSSTRKSHGVIINSIYGGQIMSTQETNKVSGRTPVWNQPFIFDIPEKNLEKYSLQFIAFCSSSVNQPHHMIGHVVIGPAVRGSGLEHWTEATHPKSVESTIWHKLQPLD